METIDMDAMRTLFRAVVMVAVGVIVVKVWQLYGPATEQVKSFAVQAVELAQTAWDRASPQSTPAPTAMADDPRPQGSPLISADAATGSTPAIATSDPVVAPQLQPVENTGPVVVNPIELTVEQVPDELPKLLSRLEEIGCVDPQLAAWGSGGELYRFSCRAPLTDTPLAARHFEAVADQPTDAVERVLATVEAWRTSQRGELSP
jgi:hypothetical protein